MDLSETSTNTNRHPWELSRTEKLIKELNNLNIKGDILDIGCGDGYFDDQLIENFPQINSVWGVDIFAKNSTHGDKKHMVSSYDEIKDKKFDFILMMDVIEHIEDDVEFLKSIKKYVKKDTVLFVTVPAFQSLFSLHDEELKHFRRYNFKQLKTVLNNAGFNVRYGSYFYLSLIFLRLLTMNKTQNLGMWENAENSFKTRFVKTCLNVDYNVLRSFSKIRLFLPGLSLLMVCDVD